MEKSLSPTGERFGRLFVVAEVGTDKGGPGSRGAPTLRLVRAFCDCGTDRLYSWKDVRAGKSRSCGCAAREAASRRNKLRAPRPRVLHGHSPRGGVSSEYMIWCAMKQRCTNPRCKSWPRYGGAGIGMCPRWLGSGGFERFLADMGPRPGPGYSVERLDNADGYGPFHSRWATAQEQARNTRRNVLLTYGGETHCAAEWAEIISLSARVITGRKRRGWSDEEALTTPVGSARR